MSASRTSPESGEPPPAPILAPELQFQDKSGLPETPRRRTAFCIGTDVNESLAHDPRDSASLPRKGSQCAENTPSSLSTSFAWPLSPIRLQAHAFQAAELKTMGRKSGSPTEEKESLLTNGESTETADTRDSEDSITTVSSTSLVLENLNRTPPVGKPSEPLEYRDDESDPEMPRWKQGFTEGAAKSMSRRLKIIIWIISSIAIVGWSIALVSFLMSARYRHSSKKPFDHESPTKSSGRRVTLAHVQEGFFSPRYESINWIPGANGEDGMLIEVNQPGKDFLVVEDVRSRQGDKNAHPSKTLLRSGWQYVNGKQVYVSEFWPSPDLKKVLFATDVQRVYRHSYTAIYYVVDIQTQTALPLDPQKPDARVQLAQWSPTGDSIAFTRDNNIYLRMLSPNNVRQITKDGGPEYFYGIPDWTYEEEVFQSNIATWWARDGKHLAFLRTNETMVPEYPVQFFMKRPSKVTSGLENYPDTSKIKYPKAGAPNPFVEILFYDVDGNEVFQSNIGGGFADDDRLIAEVLWADNGHCLIRELNRVSDHVRMVLVNVPARTGKVVRTDDIKALDGGWVEPGPSATYVPADQANGRPSDGYIDIVVNGDNHHFAYFSPMDSATPVMLTTGPWDIERDQHGLDLEHNILYFVAAKEHPALRHIYSVDLGGKSIKPIVPVDRPAYYGARFSANAGYAIIANEGPGIPTQSVITTPSNPVKYNELLTNNTALAEKAVAYELPHKIWSNITIDGFTLQVLERRPPHFDPNKKYPVLFQQYSGPGSQRVTRKFEIDFQSYVASSLEYIVVTVDGRGTGFIGRKAMCITRGELGKYEAHDQIQAAKIWAQKSYVDEKRMAIWGWSFGGFTTLKVLEQDAGQTFKYGMAVAPVTDWRFYDSIYTERFMFKPQDNQDGYDRSAINNVYNMSQNVRFLMMHGTGDDNVHMQNTLTLIDKLDLAGITNYDVHFFPDSNHNIAFHGANKMVYEKLEKWLVSAFNGAWYKYEDPQPEYKT